MSDGLQILSLRQHTSQVPPDDNWLAFDERAVQDSLKFPKRRADWRLGRWTAKQAAMAYLAQRGLVVEPAQIRIKAAADGAPELFIGEKEALALSISHSNDVGLAAVCEAGKSLGCDLEKIEMRSRRFVADYFTDGEIAQCNAVGKDQQPFLTTLIWSAKESVLKTLRQGLRLDTRDVDIAVRNNWNPDNSNSFEARLAATSASISGLWTVRDGFVLTFSSRAGGLAVDSKFVVQP